MISSALAARASLRLLGLVPRSCWALCLPAQEKAETSSDFLLLRFGDVVGLSLAEGCVSFVFYGLRKVIGCGCGHGSLLYSISSNGHPRLSA